MKQRSGFTLIEMLVAMTLTLFIMVVVTQAFVAGLETFRIMKGVGDLQELLRTAGQRIQADLKAQHFDANRHLGDPAITNQGRIRYGFFRIVQSSAKSGVLAPPYAPYQTEGADLDSALGSPGSARATDHMLHFTINLRGDRPESFFAAALPAGSPLAGITTNYFAQPPDATMQRANTYSSQWAEIAYYLFPTGATDDPTNPAATGTPLYTLYRVQRLVVPRNDGGVQTAVPVAQLGSYGAYSCETDPANAVNPNLYFNTPEDLASTPTVANAYKRSFPATLAAALASGKAVPGASAVLNNVVSFQVQIATSVGTFTDVSGAAPYFTSAAPFTFDTAGVGNTVPTTGPTRILAVQVTLRMWDDNSGQSKQVTIVQEM